MVMQYDDSGVGGWKLMQYSFGVCCVDCAQDLRNQCGCSPRGVARDLVMPDPQFRKFADVESLAVRQRRQVLGL